MIFSPAAKFEPDFHSSTISGFASWMTMRIARAFFRASRQALLFSRQSRQNRFCSSIQLHSVGGSFREQPSNPVPLPHPKSRSEKYRNEDKPHRRGIGLNLVEGAVDITDNRNPEDDVNPAENRACAR